MLTQSPPALEPQCAPIPLKARCCVNSPIGQLTLTALEGALSGLYMENHKAGGQAPQIGPEYEDRDDLTVFDLARDQLAAYFAGSLREFSVPLALLGTPFQRAAWQELLAIPYGQTVSYGHQAAKIGKPGAVRAIGTANSNNPISIIVPCHRVIGASGDLTGYGGGVDRKRWLIEHERRNAPGLFNA
jgi:methylated-DNA-[protein]-cysteine S-methyltransferase